MRKLFVMLLVFIINPITAWCSSDTCTTGVQIVRVGVDDCTYTTVCEGDCASKSYVNYCKGKCSGWSRSCAKVGPRRWQITSVTLSCSWQGTDCACSDPVTNYGWDTTCECYYPN